MLPASAALSAPEKVLGGRVVGPPSALILFGANWCAPCLAELRVLPELATSVAPGRIMLAWTDAKPATLWSSWPANADIMSRVDALRLMSELNQESAGLPFAALLDASGRICSVWRGKMTQERITILKGRCQP